MKKIVMGIAAVAMAASMFAVDFSASVQLWGTLAEGEKDAATKILGMDDANQKDTDALIMSVNGDKAGAKFQFYYNSSKADGIKGEGKCKPDNEGKYTGSCDVTISGSGVVARSAQLWFKPIDMLKIQLGNVEDDGLYKNRNDWWKESRGSQYSGWTSWYGRWSSYAAVSGYGLLATLTPIDGLTVQGGIAMNNNGNAFITIPTEGDAEFGSWGLLAKYQITDTISAGAAWAYTSGWKQLSFGADFGSWGTPYYGFVMARLFFDDGHAWWANKDDVTLTGICINNYFKYAVDAFTIHVAAPVTIRGLASGNAKTNLAGNDPSYMELSVKATYAIDAFTPYFVFGTPGNVSSSHGEGGDAVAWTFDDNFDLALEVRPGVTFNVGSVALDCGIAFIMKNDFDYFKWSIPFSAKIGF